ncbi:helix-turn-helix domain-containing protein, partial [Mycobacterium sp. NAZ190054]|uniref:helix-turn-helix domain-containing protein n=1 Tax=Mycobacterium sp. NAZ190054 TaxID=1747766 RepID=UPI001E3BAD47
VDPRVRRLRTDDPLMASTLQAYLDGFGDIAAVAARLHVHPNTATIPCCWSSTPGSRGSDPTHRWVRCSADRTPTGR